MARRSLALLLALAATGCASAQSPNSPIELAPAEARGTAAPAQVEQRHPATSAGEVAVSVVGTPFLLAFKAVVCAGSLVIAAPSAAVIAPATAWPAKASRCWGEGVARNCGPPYILTPRGV
jgi:hypothetical protein